MFSEEFDKAKREEIEHELMCRHKSVKRKVYGKTVLNRELVGYTVGGENGLLLCGTFHSMERITCAMLYKFLFSVCKVYESDDRFRQQLSKTGLTVIPTVNPDGVEISLHTEKSAGILCRHVRRCLKQSGEKSERWQANARGVDINHNFDAGFDLVKTNEKKMGITTFASTRYGGEYPESENETKALCNLCRKREFAIAAALHSQGREIYYDYGEHTRKENYEIAKAMSALSGYKVSQPSGIAVGGGFKDWFIEHFHRPAFTIEVGKGKNPLSMTVFESEYKKVEKMLWYLMRYTIKNSGG
ncbi:MAG: M14 family metallocarboxypeptidase [Eubacteriales bacterium]|nr:M14 family metallocarboxypeptidase [Eubacteriales bacterium]